MFIAPNARFALILFLMVQVLSAVSVDTKNASCAVCGMDIKIPSKTGFESIHEEKPVHFCSLSCAMRFHERRPENTIWGYDFEKMNKVDTKNSLFLVKSSKLLKEIEFGMPPVVAVFSSKEAASRARARLGDGQIVQGFDKAAEVFR